MIQCKLCYFLFGKWRTHCPSCGCAQLPNGQHVDVNTMRLIFKRNYREMRVLKVSAK
jgi:hypothetical protein